MYGPYKPLLAMDNEMHVHHDNAKDRDILYSQTVKAGRRIYYVDVKRDRNGDHYISLTESKRVGHPVDPAHQSFEKHKIFLYHEDMARFSEALAKAMQYVEGQDGPVYSSDWSGPANNASAYPSSGTESEGTVDDKADADEFRFDLEF